MSRELSLKNTLLKNRAWNANDSNEYFRKLYKLLLVCVAPASCGRGVASRVARDMEAALDRPLYDKALRLAMQTRSLLDPLLKKLHSLCAAPNFSYDGARDDILQLRKMLLLQERKERKDRLSEDDVKTIHRAWEAETEVSPDAKDTCRYYKLVPNGSPSRYEQNQVHYSFVTVEHVREVLASPPYSLDVSVAEVWHHKPYYIRKGKVNTCLCEKCENVGEVLKAVRCNMKLLMKPHAKGEARLVVQNFLRA